MTTLTSFLTIATFIKFATPSIEKDEWKEINLELKNILAIYHHHLGKLTKPEDIQHMGDQITTVVRNVLLQHPELFEIKQDKTSGIIRNTNMTIEKAKLKKKELKRVALSKNATPNDRKPFWKACRAVNDIKKT